MAHLAGIIQRGSHARIQVIQGHRLQHVEVMGHLVLHGARTVDDVLWAKSKISRRFNQLTLQRETSLQGMKLNTYFVNVLTEIPLVQELKHFLQTKEERKAE